MGRLLIVGLDGATFDLIKPWVSKGNLPNLAKLLKEGVDGELRSVIPPVSPPAWTSFMTGKNPGKHGIFDFTIRREQSYDVTFINASWRKAETIWKIMSDAGKRVCVLSVPITYPPEPINGIMISGIDTPGSRGAVNPKAIYPPELYQEIRKQVGEYLISPNLGAFDNDQCDQMVEAAIGTIDRKMTTAAYLFQKEAWDCFMITIGETDGAAHRLWKYHDKKSPLRDDRAREYAGGDPLLRIYQRVDQHLGRLSGLTTDGINIIIMSDHGHGGNGAKAIYLNLWLEAKQLLRFSTDASGGRLFSPFQKLATNLIHWAKTTGTKVLPPRLKNQILRKTKLAGKMESWLRFSHIDWGHTYAYSEETPYFPTIWINVKGREPAGIVEPGKDYEALREHLINELHNWLDPETGQHVVRKVHRREEVYSSPFIERFPDLIIEWNLDNGYSYLFKSSRDGRRRYLPISRIDQREMEKSKSGDHRDYGILIASGKDLKRGIKLDGAKIIDLAPTILYLLGLPIPSDMDGKILTQIFTDDYLASHPVRYCDGSGRVQDLTEPHQDYSEEEKESIRTRLQGLGYME